jgi:hypothetical protein
MTVDPRMAFETLFGDGATPEERRARLKVNGSILDRVSNRVAQLQAGLGPSDRNRLHEYLDDVREIERRIQRIEKYNSSTEARSLPSAPIGVPDSFEEHVKLMFDMPALAFMTGTTRISTFKMSRDVCQRVYPESGVKTPFHSCSHPIAGRVTGRGALSARLSGELFDLQRGLRCPARIGSRAPLQTPLRYFDARRRPSNEG